jgi:hypothetical protein
MTTTTEPTIHARERIAVAAGAAILAAGLILVAFVLPAEYAVDPLGTGQRVGLRQLGETGKQVAALQNRGGERRQQAAIIVPDDRPHKRGDRRVRVEAGRSMEYSEHA